VTVKTGPAHPSHLRLPGLAYAINPLDAQSLDAFGRELAIYNDTLLVGSSFSDRYDSDSGMAHIFTMTAP
jgi:hypothetical protein